VKRTPSYVYSASPIDWWQGWIDLSKHELSDFATNDEDDFGINFATEATDFLDHAKRRAADQGWEGDIIQGPFLSAMPDPDNNCSRFVVAWKQYNNGTTWIASELPLPYLR